MKINGRSFFRLTAVRKTGWAPNKVTPPPVSSTTTPDPVTAERNQKLTVPLQLQLDSVSDSLKEEYRNLLGSLRDDLYNLKMETAGFHGTLDQRLVNALRTLFNEVPDESINNTTHAINLDDTSHPSSTLVNWIISGIWF